VRLRLLPLLCSTLLLVETGCGHSAPAPTPITPAPVAPASNPPVPDRAQWEGKTLDAAVVDYLSAASIFTSTLKEIQNASSVAPNQAAVLQTAQRLRVTRFALVDLSRDKTMDADTSRKVNDASAAVAQEVARLIAIPEAKQALHEAFILIRTAPALKF